MMYEYHMRSGSKVVDSRSRFEVEGDGCLALLVRLATVIPPAPLSEASSVATYRQGCALFRFKPFWEWLFYFRKPAWESCNTNVHASIGCALTVLFLLISQVDKNTW